MSNKFWMIAYYRMPNKISLANNPFNRIADGNLSVIPAGVKKIERANSKHPKNRTPGPSLANRSVIRHVSVNPATRGQFTGKKPKIAVVIRF